MKKLKRILLDDLEQLSATEAARFVGGVGPGDPILYGGTTTTNYNWYVISSFSPSVGATSTGTYTADAAQFVGGSGPGDPWPYGSGALYSLYGTTTTNYNYYTVQPFSPSAGATSTGTYTGSMISMSGNSSGISEIKAGYQDPSNSFKTTGSIQANGSYSASVNYSYYTVTVGSSGITAGYKGPL